MGLVTLSVIDRREDVREYVVQKPSPRFSTLDVVYFGALALWVLHYAWLGASAAQHTTRGCALVAVVALAAAAFRVAHKLNVVYKESMLVIKEVGVQLQSESYFGRRKYQFVQKEKIMDVLIHEGVHHHGFIFYMAILVEGEGKMVLAFENIYPRLEMLLQIYRGTRALLFNEAVEKSVPRASSLLASSKELRFGSASNLAGSSGGEQDLVAASQSMGAIPRDSWGAIRQRSVDSGPGASREGSGEPLGQRLARRGADSALGVGSFAETRASAGSFAETRASTSSFAAARRAGVLGSPTSLRYRAVVPTSKPPLGQAATKSTGASEEASASSDTADTSETNPSDSGGGDSDGVADGGKNSGAARNLKF